MDSSERLSKARLRKAASAETRAAVCTPGRIVVRSREKANTAEQKTPAPPKVSVFASCLPSKQVSIAKGLLPQPILSRKVLTSRDFQQSEYTIRTATTHAAPFGILKPRGVLGKAKRGEVLAYVSCILETANFHFSSLSYIGPEHFEKEFFI